MIDSGWLGFPPATETDISEAEHRIGTRLPPSLRDFYAVTNGWRTTGPFVWEVLPTTRIGWLQDLVPQLYDMATAAEAIPGPFKKDPGDARLMEYRLEQGTRVKRSLVLSLEGDASNWLLDPGTLNRAGEWAAGRWSSWNPAMEWQAESFAELMREELKTFRRLTRDERG
ncbi:MAG: hypothetical protein C5B50_12070 [Verrucomicrobia bacterium]|nr:MAG: hypothetical protein C5B50_12070 [Verrucomicrobiota bacterium]